MPDCYIQLVLLVETVGTLPGLVAIQELFSNTTPVIIKAASLVLPNRQRGAYFDSNAPTHSCLQLQDQVQAAALRGMEALEAATGVSLGSADQMEEDDEDEIDDEIDPDDEDEELAMQQPPVHDVHVSSEAVPAAGTSGRDRVPDPSRLLHNPKAALHSTPLS